MQITTHISMKTVIEEIIMIIFDWNMTNVIDGKAT